MQYDLSGENSSNTQCSAEQNPHRDASNANEVDPNQEDSEASNPGGEKAPQPALGEEGHNGSGKGANHVGSQELAIGVIPGVTLVL